MEAPTSYVSPRKLLRKLSRERKLRPHSEQPGVASLADVFEFEKRVQTRLFLSADAREGMQAFVDKRSPKFT